MLFERYELERLVEAMISLDYSGCGCLDDRTDHDNLLRRLVCQLEEIGSQPQKC